MEFSWFKIGFFYTFFSSLFRSRSCAESRIRQKNASFATWQCALLSASYGKKIQFRWKIFHSSAAQQQPWQWCVARKWITLESEKRASLKNGRNEIWVFLKPQGVCFSRAHFELLRSLRAGWLWVKSREKKKLSSIGIAKCVVIGGERKKLLLVANQ